MKSLVLTLFLAVLLAGASWADGHAPNESAATTRGVEANEQAPMKLGGIILELGMEEEKLLEQLRDVYLIEPVRDNTWSAWDKEESDRLHGIMMFRKGKLVWASRDWGTFEGKEVHRFAQFLFNRIIELTDSDPDQINITASITAGDDNAKDEYVAGSLTLSFKERDLELFVGYSGDMTDVAVEEILKAEPGDPLISD